MIHKFPYYTVLISLSLPFFASHFNIELHRILLVFVSFIFVCWIIKKGDIIVVNKYILFFYFIFTLLVIIDMIIGRGLRTFSMSHSLIYIFIFFHIYILNNHKISAKILFNQSDIIFKIIIIFLLIESLFLVTGNFNYLQKLFPVTGSSIVEGFRAYHNRFSDFYRLGFPGLNSLITGNQVASNLALFSMVWFAPIYKFPPRKNSRIIWFILSALLLLFSPTMSAIGLLLIAMFFLIFILSVSNIRKLNIFLPVIFVIILVGSWSIKFIFLPVISSQLIEGIDGFIWYKVGLLSPFQNYFSMTVKDMILGAQSEDYASRFFFNEIGTLRVAMNIGLPLIILVSISSIISLIKSIRIASTDNLKKVNFSPQFHEYQTYVFLAQVNILIVLLWLFSTFHYLIIFRLGAVQLIAFQFTVSVFSIYQSNKILKNI